MLFLDNQWFAFFSSQNKTERKDNDKALIFINAGISFELFLYLYIFWTTNLIQKKRPSLSTKKNDSKVGGGQNMCHL